jgi:putative sterol carrier protein
VELIESWLPQQIDTSSFGEASFSVRLSLSGVDGGDFCLCVDGEGLAVASNTHKAGRPNDPDIWVRLSTSDFRALLFSDEDLPIPSIISEDFAPLLAPLPEDLEAFAKLDGRIRFELLGRRHRRFSLDLSFGERGMRAGRPRATISIDAGTCEKLVTGKQNPIQAVLGDQLRVEGDRGFALQVMVLCASRRRG